MSPEEDTRIIRTKKRKGSSPTNHLTHHHGGSFLPSRFGGSVACWTLNLPSNFEWNLCKSDYSKNWLEPLIGSLGTRPVHVSYKGVDPLDRSVTHCKASSTSVSASSVPRKTIKVSTTQPTTRLSALQLRRREIRPRDGPICDAGGCPNCPSMCLLGTQLT